MSTRFRKNSIEQLNLKNARSLKIGIAVSEWHSEVTEALYEGAINILVKNGIKKDNIIRKNTPGSFELPLSAQILLRKNKVDAVICLGCVIKGETDHYYFICDAIARGIMEVSLSHNKPVAFGVLTTENIEQALNRAGGKFGNKGNEAALSILKTLLLMQSTHKDF